MGQLQWMDYEALLPATKTLLKTTTGLAEVRVDRIIQEAQEVLYRPDTSLPNLSARISVVYAVKRTNLK
jgi:hypothetical protein